MTAFRISVVICALSSLVIPEVAASFCFEEAGEQFGVSPAILWAIAKEESNFDTAAINLNKNGTYDFGLMQINSWWADILGQEAWASLAEPCYNVKVGAWILSQCIQEHGYTWEAIGCYNARGDRSKKRYAWMIHNALVKHGTGYKALNSHSTRSKRM